MGSLLLLAAGPSGADAACRTLLVGKVAGDAVLPADTTEAECPGVSLASGLRYDRVDGTVRARTDLAAGELLGRVYFSQRPAAAAGERVVVTARVGPVTITRSALALQPAASGKRFFARLDDGTIIVAPPISEETP